MSDTTQVMGSPPEAQDVHAYITAVRAWLGDLPAEDVEDLTVGMEADLGERVAESGGRLGDLLGQPEAYAAELRSAAGLPPRAAPTGATPRRRGMTELSDSVSGVGDSLVLRFPWLRELRPTWWIARGVVAGWFVGMFFGTIPRTIGVMAALGAAGSFWLGRRMTRLGVPRWVRSLVALGNVVATLIACVAVVVALSSATSYDEAYQQPWSPPGLSLDGNQVQNLYVYDANGNQVDGARIYDQDGQGLSIDPTTLGDEAVPVRPDGTPDVATDVFPLAVGDVDPWGDAGYGWTPPLRLPPLPVVPGTTSSDAGPSGAANGTATATPGVSPTAIPEVSPTATPGASPTATPATPSPTPTPTGSGG